MGHKVSFKTKRGRRVSFTAGTGRRAPSAAQKRQRALIKKAGKHCAGEGKIGSKTRTACLRDFFKG